MDLTFLDGLDFAVLVRRMFLPKGFAGGVFGLEVGAFFGEQQLLFSARFRRCLWR